MPELQSQINALNAKANFSSGRYGNRDSLNKQLADESHRLAQAGQQIHSNPGDNRRAQPGPCCATFSATAAATAFIVFQIFACTVVLGIIFVSSVYNNLSMPEFSTNVAGLMGHQFRHYIGFKFPEKN